MSKHSKAPWRRLIPVLHSATNTTQMNARTLYALASLLVLVQLPHVFNLPVWTSATGLILVACRLVLLKKPDHRTLRVFLSPIAVTLIAFLSAFIIKWDFGYFVGRDSCVAFLFILVAAKFAEVRRDTDATLLLCLCSFLLLTQYFYSQTILSALVTLPAVIALGYSLAILRDPNTRQPVAQIVKLIGALLLQGLPIAALLFVLFPRLPGPLWSLPEDTKATTGLSDSMSPGSIGTLSQSDAVAFRVEFDGKTPRQKHLYWRGPVLTRFDGRNWSLSNLQYDATPKAALDDQARTDYTVTLQAHQRRWMFALDAAASLPRNYSASKDPDYDASPTLGRMREDGQMLANEAVTQPLRYRQSSLLSDKLPAFSKPRSDTLFLPEKNTRTIRFAKELRNRSASDLDYAAAVMDHFNKKPFRYTLQPQLLGSTPVDEFLFDTREGFCEHYASAFVVMMRAVGIPARIVTGYLGGETNNDYLIVRQSDAHAWTEIYIDGIWQRFDPTAAVAPSRVESGLAAALPNETSVPRLSRQTPGLIRDWQLRWDALNHQWQRLVIDYDNDSQDSLWERAGLDKPVLWQLCLLVILVAGIWSALVIGLPRWQRTNLPPHERQWRRLVNILKARSLVRHPGESVSEYMHRAGKRWPHCAERLQRLENSFIALRFQSVKDEKQKALLSQSAKDLTWLHLNLLLQRRTKAH